MMVCLGRNEALSMTERSFCTVFVPLLLGHIRLSWVTGCKDRLSVANDS